MRKFNADKKTEGWEKSNGDRANHAAVAVAAACRERGEPWRADEDGIRDLLADLGHLCDREGLAFCQLVAVAKRAWRAER